MGGVSPVGRATPSHGVGRGFESHTLHQLNLDGSPLGRFYNVAGTFKIASFIICSYLIKIKIEM